MNGYPSGGLRAIALGYANACRVGSVHAKTREGKARHHKGPHRKFCLWSPSTTSSRNLSARARDEVVSR